ncbi:LuxR C-terminal-related transcriptional regulator [Mycobacterium sp. CPCC 205372]|uniref:LuxR C-terminal-related transcriptional regulator n=1 Tax=Mycobacterium hippophais TaxID=3016340 RepID=A0ABT4PVJ3_9MYCO|nr:LuxR family transcriptional regulator [Mycobacterium hippophais]MCZ8380555.1 LuxR C-terminal-related transcriptional regulator [Mycobacterium hippophais]
MASKDRLLERDAVLAELDRLQRATARGSGRLLLLRGEAGIGKTTTIGRFVAGLGGPLRVTHGWCDAVTAPRPLGPLIDMLADISGERATALRAAIETGDIEAVYAGLLGLFGNETAWVWVVEDVHWADGATLDLLRFLVRRIDSLPLLLVVSYRDDEIGDQHPLAMLLGDVATSPVVTRIGLQPLSVSAVGELSTGSGINAEELHRLTAGNPFYVTEVLAAGSGAMTPEALPRSVSEAVWGRLARLTTVGRETAHATAVCGPRADPVLVQRVCPAAEDGLPECLNAGVLVADAQTVGFRHELARRAALEQIPAYRRRELHRQAMTVLAEPPTDPDVLSALTFHADQAEDYEAVITHGPAAAERASALGANREAAKLYALTLRHADAVPDERRVIWLENHALSSHLSGLPDAAVSSFRAAAALRHALGDRLDEAADLRNLSYILWLLGRTTEALEAGQASLHLLEGGESCQQLAWSLGNMADLTAGAYDARCPDFAARAIAVGTELGNSAVVVRARSVVAIAGVLRDGTGWDELEEAWRSAKVLDEAALHAGPIAAGMCWFAALHQQLERADAYIGETSAFCEAHDLGAFQVFATGAAALAALHRGEWDRALAYADDVLTRPSLAAMHRVLPLVSMGLVRARRGEQHATGLHDETLAAADPDNLFLLGLVWVARAEAAWLAGDDDTARATALAGLAVATERADPWLVGGLRRWAHLTGGLLDDAPTLDTITPFRLEVGGDWTSAAAEWTRLGCPYDAAVAQLGGDIADVEAALDTFRRLGARAAARRAQQRLARLRGRDSDTRRKATIADPYGLTPRERDVLELVAAGHSDAGIAAELFISPKTANRHVGAILAKLGVRNRTQAAAYAHQRPASSSP